MPQAADITVKNGGGVDKTFNLVSQAAGDGGIATWALREGPISSVFPTLTIQTERKGTSRSLKLKFYVPSSYTDSVTGRTMVAGRTEYNLTVAVPNDFPEALKADTVAFATNLLSSTLVKACLIDAIPAT